MDISRIYGEDQRGSVAATSCGVRPVADGLVPRQLGETAQGDASSFFDMGVTSSTGSHGGAGDFIEAHKWFNLAAMAGHECAQGCRAEISGEMTPGEIAEAQRRAREWIAATRRRAA